MKLSHATGSPQGSWVMVGRFDRMWSTGEGNGKPLSILALRTPWTVWKAKMIGYWKRNSPSVGTQHATGDQWRNNSRKNEGMEPKQKQYPVVDVTGDRSKDRCCKEQYCIGTWNVRFMNQGKSEVVKQEMARVNILGISELKWTGMGEFNSDDHYIYYCGQESLRGNGVTIMVDKSPKCSTWMQSQKWKNDLCLFPRQTIQYHGNPSLCSNQWCWSWMVLWRPARPFRTDTKKM